MHLIKKYKNVTILIVTSVLGTLLGFYPPYQQFLGNLDGFGYFGAFFAGMLFVSTFTFATGTSTLVILAHNLDPLFLAGVAGAGGVLGDFMLFNFIRIGLGDEVKEIFEYTYHRIQSHAHLNFGQHYLKTMIKSKYFAWTLPVIGAIIVASPLPDEAGVTLIGISKMKRWEFVLLSFALNTLGVFIVVSAAVLA